MRLDDPKLRIVVPTRDLMLSLYRRLSRFPGEKGMAIDLNRAYFAVEVVDFPRQPTDLERVLEIVRSWLDEVGVVDAITVESRWQVRTTRSREKERQIVSWKFEEGPEDATEEGSPEDAGPAWIDTFRGDAIVDTEPVADGAWITRAEARRLAAERGYELNKDA
jgi:hypothetical protein